MNAIAAMAARPLIELLGARWTVPTPPTALAWDSAGALAAFGFADGSVAMLRATWHGAAALRARKDGGAELVPASAAPPPFTHVAVHRGACLSIAADPDGGFLSGGVDGQVARVFANGTIETIARLEAGAATQVAAGRGGWRAAACGSVVRRVGGTGAAIAVPGPVAALALDPTGARLAIGYPGGVALWAGGDTPRRLDAPGTHARLAWSGDGSAIASATREGRLHCWSVRDGTESNIPTLHGVVALAAGSDFLVAGVGGRVACWRAGAGALEPCGVDSRTAVTVVATQPRKPLVAVGYDNGAVSLCRPGSDAVLFLHGAGNGAVGALAFTADAGALALATTGGEIAIVPLPALLFRAEAGSR